MPPPTRPKAKDAPPPPDGEVPKALTYRPVQGPKCAQCGEPTGMVTINGHSIVVEPYSVIVRGGGIFLALHLCSKPDPDIARPKAGGPKR